MLKEIFKQPYQHYTPERIKAIRESLKETQEEFGQRFFVSAEAVKSWESKSETKNRELPGPATRLMIVVEEEAAKKRNYHAKGLRLMMERKRRELKEMRQRYEFGA